MPPIYRQKRLVLCALVGAIALGVAWLDAGAAGSSVHDAREAIAASLARDGIEVDPHEVVLLDGSSRGVFGGLAYRPVVLLGALGGHDGGARDLYYLEAQIASAGRLIALRSLTNLTRSAATDESPLVASADGRFVAFGSRLEDGFAAVTVLDLWGEPARLTADWGVFGRLGNRITNLQETGRVEGVGRRRWALTRFSSRLRLRIDGEHLRGSADREDFALDLNTGRILADTALLVAEPVEKGKPGLIGWAVDTVRRVPFVGARGIEWLEHAWFALWDKALRLYYRGMPAENEAAIARDLVLDDPARSSRTSMFLPGWPPRSSATLPGRRPYAHEGEWASLEGDPFVTENPGGPPLFYTTYLRPDPERDFARVYATIWDPRLVELRMQAGTREPLSATGTTGSGEVLRDPRIFKRLVAGFNGGFQAMHGEFGMMVDDALYLPPKPYAATVAVLRGGRVGFGSWPGQSEPIPPDIVSFRQNLTPLVDGGRFNPFGRNWWGGAPPTSTDPVHTIRTGLCMTEEGFGAYFWGVHLAPVALANAMRQTRCAYAIHLDMNYGHSGFEFYRVTADRTPLGRPLNPRFEAEGAVSGLSGLYFRARRMARDMAEMNFPRYIRRDPRDFFYLLRRRTLPPEPIELAYRAHDDGRWQIVGQRGAVPAVARTTVHPDPNRPGLAVRLWAVDPARVDVDAGGLQAPLFVAAGVEAAPGALALDAGAGASAPLAEHAPTLYLEAPYGPNVTLSARIDAHTNPTPLLAGGRPADVRFAVQGVPLDSPAAPRCRAAAGIDAEGMLLLAQADEPNPRALAEALRAAGAERTLGLLGARVEMGVPADLTREARRGVRLALVGNDARAAVRMFPDVVAVDPRLWYPLQAKRVRYFPRRAATAAATSDAGAPPPNAPNATNATSEPNAMDAAEPTEPAENDASFDPSDSPRRSRRAASPDEPRGQHRGRRGRRGPFDPIKPLR